ncbi:UNVERIFIED_CONTAM: hypothetical protein FKN15_010112 [Acipenser sinensis]
MWLRSGGFVMGRLRILPPGDPGSNPAMGIGFYDLYSKTISILFSMNKSCCASQG